MKKGAYDLGRKSVYFIVVAFYLAFIFAYAANMVINYQEDTLQDLDTIDRSLILPRLGYCFAFHDSDVKASHYGILELEKITEKALRKCFGVREFMLTLENLETRSEMPEKITVGTKPGDSTRVFTKLVVVRSKEKNIESLYNLKVET